MITAECWEAPGKNGRAKDTTTVLFATFQRLSHRTDLHLETDGLYIFL